MLHPRNKDGRMDLREDTLEFTYYLKLLWDILPQCGIKKNFIFF